MELQEAYLSTVIITSFWKLDSNLSVCDGTLCAIGFNNLKDLSRKNIEQLSSNTIKVDSQKLEVSIDGISGQLSDIFQLSGNYAVQGHTHHLSDINEISNMTFKSLSEKDYSDISSDVNQQIGNFILSGDDNRMLNQEKIVNFKGTYELESGATPIQFYVMFDKQS